MQSRSAPVSVLLRLLTFAFCLFPFAWPALAQGPSENWQTRSTQHFRIHYPAEYDVWATRAASRLEAVHAAVSKEIGFTPPQVIDVVVRNPLAEPNGVAWPFLDTPRIELYVEAPEADEQIGSYSHWIDLLTVHEVAHVVHMLRPSRNPMRRALERFVLPLNAITTGAPRWVLEGYATVIEGRLTGAGRPTSTMRAAILRKWAASGRLPSYDQLDSDQRFLGMSMAYLAGSAFLEWLEARSGAGSLQKVWARMTARQRRSFDTAFAGVFGESPERLYGQFTAELTEAAVTIARSRALREGELWQETSHATGDPAISPDGSRLALVVRARNKPPRLVILETGEPVEEEKEYRERIEKILGRDPEDVAPVRSKPLPREPKHTLVLPDGGDIESPRWTHDGKSLLYSHRQPDPDGFLHWDLFRWTPESDENVRITHLADIRDSDPYPDDRTAVALRSRYGLTQLVRVDLATGAVTPINEPSIDIVYSHPRLSRDGKVAHLEHREGSWRLFADGKEVARDAASPEWGPDGALYATISTRGFAEIHRIGAGALTRSVGGAIDPAPSTDRIFFMSLEPDGFVVRTIAANSEPLPPPTAFDRPLIPALPPPAPAAAPFAEQQLAPARPYGIGRQEWGWLVSQNIAADLQSTEAGVRFGDVIGRLDTLLIGSFGDEKGLTLTSAWRGWPVEAHAQAFTYEGLQKQSGLELRGVWSHRAPLWRTQVEAGALGGDENLGFVDAAISAGRRLGSWRPSASLRIGTEQGDYDHSRAIVRASVTTDAFTIALQWRRDDGDFVSPGGLPSSILPRSLLSSRVFEPALPLATLGATDYDGRRIEASLAALPVTAFFQQHRMGAQQIDVAGIELTTSSGPNPILKTSGFDLTAGVARVLDEPRRGDTQFWLGMRWRP